VVYYSQDDIVQYEVTIALFINDSLMTSLVTLSFRSERPNGTEGASYISLSYTIIVFVICHG